MYYFIYVMYIIKFKQIGYKKWDEDKHHLKKKKAIDEY